MKTLKRLLKWLALGAGVAVGLVILAYFLVSSQWFMKSQVLPRVSQALGTPVSAERSYLSPFSAFEMYGVQVGDGQRPLARIGTLRCHYSLWAMMHGELLVTEFMLADTKVQLVQDATGAWNLPKPPAAAAPTPSAKPAGSGTSGTPIVPNVTNVRVQNLEVTVDTVATSAMPARHIELRAFNLSLPELRPNVPVKLEWDGKFAVNQAPAVSIKAGELSGSLALELDAKFMPRSATLTTKLGGFNGSVQGIDLAQRTVTVNLSVSGDGNKLDPIKCRVEAANGAQTEAALTLTGTVVVKPLKIDLDVVADPISSSALNLAGGLAGGFDFGHTMARYIGHVTVSDGNVVESRGKLAITQATVKSPTLQLPACPPVDIVLEHDAAINLTSQSAKLNALLATVTEQGNEVVALKLSEPLALAWGGPGSAPVVAAPAKLNLAVRKFNVQLASPFVPPATGLKLQGGLISANLEAQVANLGKGLALSGTINATNLAYELQGKTVEDLTVNEAIELTLTDFKQLKVTRQETEVTLAGKPVLTAQATATLDLNTRAGQVDLVVASCTERLMALAPLPSNVTRMIRKLEVNSRVKLTLGEQAKRITATGEANIPVLDARLPDGTTVPPLQTAVAFDVSADLLTSTATLNALKASVSEQQRQVVNLTLSAPATVSWAANAGSRDAVSPAEIRLVVDRLNLALANPFLTAAKAEIPTGTVSVDLRAVIGQLGRDAKLAGTLSGDGITARLPQGTFEKIGFTAELNGSLRDLRSLDLAGDTFELRVDGRSALKVVAQGKIDLQDLAGDLTVEIPQCDETLLAAIPDALFPAKKQINSFGLKAKVTASLRDKAKTIEARGQLSVADASVTPAGMKRKLPFQAEVAFDLGMAQGREVRLRTFSASVDMEQRKLLALDATGKLFLPPAKEESTVDVNAGDIDLKALADIFAPPGQARKTTRPDDAPAAPAGSMPTAEPPAVKLDGITLTANLNVKSLTYGDIRIAPLKNTLKIKDNVVSITPLDFTLNGTPVHTTAEANVGLPGYRYKINSGFEKLDFAPFISTFAPKFSSQVTGSVKTLKFDFSGQGITPANLSRNAAGEIVLEIGTLVLANLPQLVDLADSYDIPELKRIQIDKGIIRLRPEDGVLKIVEGTFQGKDLRMDLSGQFWFDLRQKIDITPGIGPSIEAHLQERSIPTQYLGDRVEGYLMLPTLEILRGTVTQPIVNKDIKGTINKLIKKALSNAGKAALTNLGTQLLQGGKIDTGSLLKGALTPQGLPATGAAATAAGAAGAPAGAATPSPAAAPASAVPAKKTDATSSLLNSMLGGGTAAPRPATPAPAPSAAPTPATIPVTTPQPAPAPGAAATAAESAVKTAMTPAMAPLPVAAPATTAPAPAPTPVTRPQHKRTTTTTPTPPAATRLPATASEDAWTPTPKSSPLPATAPADDPTQTPATTPAATAAQPQAQDAATDTAAEPQAKGKKKKKNDALKKAGNNLLQNLLEQQQQPPATPAPAK